MSPAPGEATKEKPQKALSVGTLTQFPGHSKSRSQTGKGGSPKGVRKWRKGGEATFPQTGLQKDLYRQAGSDTWGLFSLKESLIFLLWEEEAKEDKEIKVQAMQRLLKGRGEVYCL